MNRAACVLAVVLAGCAGDESAPDPAGTNPPTLWLAMASGGSQMSLVGVEPHPY